jgi:hypothetical protein
MDRVLTPCLPSTNCERHDSGCAWCDADLDAFAAMNADPRVMEKLGMHRAPAQDFDHPRLPEGHLLRRHVRYRITRP